MVNVALSRRVARVIGVAPLTRLASDERTRLASAAEDAHDFGDLPKRYQQLILEAEATAERLLSRRREASGA
jgi:hypothetical protein